MPANLYQRGSTWYARVQINGRDERRSLRTSDRAEARRRLKAILDAAEKARAGIAEPAAHTFEDAAVRWQEVQWGELRPRTVERYKTSLRQLAAHFAGRPIRSIDTAAVHEFVTRRMRGGAKGATVRRDLTVLSRIMRVARRAGWIEVNPVPDEAEEIKERREPIRPVSLRAFAVAARRAPPGLAAMARFALRTGCREEEAASLEWAQIDLRAGTVTFIKTKTRSPRVARLTPQAVRDLLRLPRDPDSPYVFRAAHGGRYGNVPGRWRKIMEVAGVAGAFRFHDLRHTYAIRALQKGVSIYEVARQLGHSTVKTTEIYSAWLARRPE